MIELKTIHQKINANIIIHSDKNGTVLDFLNTKHQTNIALMTEAVAEMCGDLFTDITKSKPRQIIVKSDEHYYIINRLNTEDQLLFVSCDDISKLGLHMRYLNSL